MASIHNPTQRNTEARIAKIRGSVYYFSYDTCIAFDGTHAVTGEPCRGRLPNSWGPTTGRHFKEMGIADFPIMENAEFSAMVG